MLTATAAGEQQIDLSWTVPADNGSAAITGYVIERSKDGDAPWERLSGRHRTTTYSDTDVYSGTTRHYRVAATNGAGTGPFSAVVSATTEGEPAESPQAPHLLHFNDLGRNHATIAWDPPKRDGDAPITGYEYQVAVPCEDDPQTDKNESERNCGFDDDETTATTAKSARISGLNIDGLYRFRVRAVNPIGQGEWSHDNGRTTLKPISGRRSAGG